MKEQGKPPVNCKMMKSLDPSKTEVHLFFKFEDSNFTTESLMQYAITLLNERIGWTDPEVFYQLLAAAADSSPDQPTGLQ
jgi:hypothetical protein